MLAVEYLREMRHGTPPITTPAPAKPAGGAEAVPQPPVPPRASIDLESPFAVEASEGALELMTRLVRGLADGSLLAASDGTPLRGPALAAVLRIARATLRRGVAAGVSLAVAGFATAGSGGAGGARAASGAEKPSAALLDLAGAVQAVTTWGGLSAGVALSQIPATGGDAAPQPSPPLQPAAAAADAAVQQAAWTLLEYLPLGGTTALLLRKAAAGAGVLELELTWPWAEREPTPDALPVHMESLVLALQVRSGMACEGATPPLTSHPHPVFARSYTPPPTAGARASSAAGPPACTSSSMCLLRRASLRSSRARSTLSRSKSARARGRRARITRLRRASSFRCYSSVRPSSTVQRALTRFPAAARCTSTPLLLRRSRTSRRPSVLSCQRSALTRAYGLAQAAPLASDLHTDWQSQAEPTNQPQAG